MIKNKCMSTGIIHPDTLKDMISSLSNTLSILSELKKASKQSSIDYYIWTIGDKTNYGIVTRFEVRGKQMAVQTEHCISVNYDLSLLEKVKDKDYEILSFVDYKNVKEFYKKNINGGFTNGLSNVRCDENYLLDNNYKIHSVKRKFDNVIFNIGDKISSDGVNQDAPISEFRIHKNSLYVSGENIAWGVHLKDLEKVKQQPILRFKAQDGKNIYEGDRFYTVTDNFEIVFSDAVGGQVLTPEIILRSYSTQGAAREYIIQNKPTLSLKEVYAHLNIDWKWTYERLKELVKRKIDGVQ
jgi:hypothetical protein